MREVPDLLEMAYDTEASSIRYASFNHNYQLIEHIGYWALVKEDDFSFALCYKERIENCPRNEYVFNCFKKASISGFKDKWVTNTQMRIECLVGSADVASPQGTEENFETPLGSKPMKKPKKPKNKRI